MELTAEGTSKTAQVKGLTIHYHEAGQGPVILFIHGSGPGASAWSNFQRNLGHFAETRRVIALDLPNWGKSTVVGPPTSGLYGFYADLIVAFLGQLGIEEVDLVGNSLGGGISLCIALDHPNLVRRMVLMGSGGSIPLFSTTPTEGIKHLMEYYSEPGPSREKLNNFLQMMVYDTSLLSPELVEQRFAASTDPEKVAKPPFTRTQPPNPETLFPRFGEIKQPTLLIWGREDRTLALDNAFLLLKMISDIRLHVFGQCGHWAQWERPSEFNALVKGFFDEPDRHAA